MLALLMKDIYMLSKQLKFFILLIVIFSALSIVNDLGLVLILFALIFGSLQLSSAFTLDEMCGWDRYVNTFPFKRKTIVQSKYVLGLISTFGAVLILLPITLLSSEFSTLPSEYIRFIVALIVTFGILYISIVIPFYIKFGSQKGRIIIFAIVFIPTFSSGFISTYLQKVGINTLIDYSYIAPIVSLLIAFISYIISVKWYEQKEF